MIQLTIIRIEGYGPWTVTLGSDRETHLQMLQAKIYHDVQRLFSENNCIVFFNRFDEYFAITNGLDALDHKEIQHNLAELYDDLKMSMAIGAGKTAFEANLSAYSAKKVTAGTEIKLNCGIGIGKTGRKAAEGATKALDTIRDLRRQGKIQPIYEIRCL